MQRRLKERLIGAAVLVMLAVIFIPMVLDNTTETGSEITRTNIPPRPDIEFSSRIIPVEDPPVVAPEGTATSEDAADLAQTEVTVAESPVAEVPEVEQSQPVEAPARVETGAVGLTAWVVQLGSFSNEENASSLNLQLREAGFTAFVEPLQKQSKTFYRVRVGPELLRSDAQLIREQIMEKMQIEGDVIQYP